MTKLQEVRKAIISVVPDIMKLEMGCKVRVEWSHGSQSIESIDRSPGYLRSDGLYGTHLHKGTAEIIEIIGRDIYIRDVLMAVQKIGWNQNELSVGDIEEQWAELLSLHWSLPLPLHLQDEPTIAFLHDLLYKK